MAYADLLKTTAVLQVGSVSTRSTTGEEVESWSPLGSELVMIRPANQGFRADLGNHEDVSHIVYTGYIAALAENPQGRYRFVVGSAVYNVVDPHDPAGYGHHLEFKTRKVALE